MPTMPACSLEVEPLGPRELDCECRMEGSIDTLAGKLDVEMFPILDDIRQSPSLGPSFFHKVNR